jgi:hypothetical protein
MDSLITFIMICFLLIILTFVCFLIKLFFDAIERSNFPRGKFQKNKYTVNNMNRKDNINDHDPYRFKQPGEPRGGEYSPNYYASWPTYFNDTDYPPHIKD